MAKCSVVTGGVAYDDRGALAYFNDLDLGALGVRRMYMVTNNDACSIRAWHGHMNEGKYVVVLEGSAIIAAVPMVEKSLPYVSEDSDYGDVTQYQHRLRFSEMERFVVSAKQPKIIYIPPGMANGTRTLEPNTKLMFLSTSTLEQSKGDDYRFPFHSSVSSGWLCGKDPFIVEVR